MTVDHLPKTPAEVVKEIKQYDLTNHRQSWERMLQLKQIIDEATAEYERYAKRLKAVAGEADELVLDGEIVATHAVSSKFMVAQFRKTHPDLAAEFTVQRTTEVIDEDELKSKHPWLYQSFRSRSLRIK